MPGSNGGAKGGSVGAKFGDGTAWGVAGNHRRGHGARHSKGDLGGKSSGGKGDQQHAGGVQRRQGKGLGATSAGGNGERLVQWDCTQPSCFCLDNHGTRVSCRQCGAGAPAFVLKALGRGGDRGQRHGPTRAMGTAPAAAADAGTGARAGRWRRGTRWICYRCDSGCTNFGKGNCEDCGRVAPKHILLGIPNPNDLRGTNMRPATQTGGGGPAAAGGSSDGRRLAAKVAQLERENAELKKGRDGPAAEGVDEDMDGPNLDALDAATTAAKGELDELTKYLTDSLGHYKANKWSDEEIELHHVLGSIQLEQRTAAQNYSDCLGARRAAMPLPVRMERQRLKVKDQELKVSKTGARIKGLDDELEQLLDLAAKVREKLAKEQGVLGDQQAKLSEFQEDYDAMLDVERASRPTGDVPDATQGGDGGMHPMSAPSSRIQRVVGQAAGHAAAAEQAGALPVPEIAVSRVLLEMARKAGCDELVARRFQAIAGGLPADWGAAAAFAGLASVVELAPEPPAAAAAAAARPAGSCALALALAGDDAHDLWANPSQSLGAVPGAGAVLALPASGARRGGPYESGQEKEAKRQKAALAIGS